ncbi:MAG: PAS domain S-box protein [Mariniphaga sp.]|nr:PAS domain S-box protein [Mariniphaga sp.]
MKKDSKSASSENPRQREEAPDKMNPAKSALKLDEEQILKLIHDHEVHQVELEMQKQELLLANAQITAAAQKYAGLYDFAPTGYFTLAKNGEIVDLNLCGSQMLDRNREYLKSRMFVQYVNDDSKPIFSRFLDKVFSCKSKETCEVALQMDSNLPVYVNLSGAVTEDNEQCLLIAVDITGRKNAETILLEEKFQYHNLVNAGIALTWTACIDKLCNYFNDAWLKFTGRTLEQEMGNGWTEGVHPDDLERCLLIYTTAFDRRKPFEMEYRLRHVSGEYRWILDIGTPNYNNSGEFIGYIGNCFDITERRNSEKLLRKSEERYRSLMTNLSAGVIVHAPDTSIIMNNHRAAELLALNDDQMKGRLAVDPNWKFIDESGFPLSVDDYPVNRIIASKKPFSEVLIGVVQPENHNIVWLTVNGFPVFDSHGEIAEVLISFIDITERKLAEEAIIESEHKFREAVSNLDEGYYSVSPDGIINEHNKAFCRILGFDLTTDLQGVYMPDFWQNHDERTDYLDSISKYGAISNYQIKIKTQTGEKKTVLASAHMVKDKDRKPLRIEGVFLDISDRIRMEEALQRNAGRLQNLHKIDKAILSPVETPDAIIQKALQHIRSLLSSQHASIGIFDFENEALQLFAADIKDGSIEQTERYMIDKVYGDLEILQQNRMDVVEDISLKSSPPELLRILQSEGIMSCINLPLISGEKLIGAMNLGWKDSRAFTPEELEIASEVADEITIAIEQIRLRQEAKRYTEEIEKKVKERTSELLTANKELEAFSYSVSHDLRAPLMHINGYISLLSKHLKHIIPEKEKHYLEVIADSARQMGILIDDLLNFSRTGRQEMQLTELDMNVVLKDALQVIQHESVGRDISWIVESLPQVNGDYAMMRLVWLNLLSNAAKFFRANVISRIEVGVVDHLDEFVFFVRDNGVGFDMQYANKLFGVFERLHSSQEFEGTGIGLANVRRIIQRHGGRTWAEAEVDKGATFYFSIPKENQKKIKDKS